MYNQDKQSDFHVKTGAPNEEAPWLFCRYLVRRAGQKTNQCSTVSSDTHCIPEIPLLFFEPSL